MSRPQPFRQFILKIHSRCDLACSYCYVYTKVDQRWRARPKVMSRELVGTVSRRIGEHVRAHCLDRVDVVLHGGEPLLAGADRIADCARALRAAVEPAATVSLRLQTNAMLLNRDMTDVLARHGIMVGVSLDGGPADHDRHRHRPDGSGSHAAVARALTGLIRGPHRNLFSGLLCTIDPHSDPVATYEALLAFEPPTVDFLLPHGNWSAPPPALDGDPAGTPYADWLIAVFDRWYGAPLLETRVRTFDQILGLLMGGRSTVAGLGTEPMVCVVIETDGSIEQSDMLTTAYEGAGATGLHVSTDPFDAVLPLPAVAASQSGAAALSATCRGCRVVRVCGGGLHAHRFRAGPGFANPSVYCRDLFRLIRHCHDRLAPDVAELRAAAGGHR